VKVRELAQLVHGRLVGDGDVEIRGARTLEEAGPGDITFIEDAKHAKLLLTTRASAVVARDSLPVNGHIVIQVSDPLLAFVDIARQMGGHDEPCAVPGIDPDARVDTSAQVGEGTSIQAFARVGPEVVIGCRCRIFSGVVLGRGCRLGDDVTLYPNAVLYDWTRVGNRVIVHSNAVLGADGFGYRLREGRHVKVPQLGRVEIEDDVEIGACTTIDRGTFGETRIGGGTKIDNLVQIGHNCKIGRHNIFISQMGIAGSSTTGDYVVVAGQVGIVGHIEIGTGAMIGGQAGVTKDVPAGAHMLGSPATPEREQKRILMTLERLPEIRRDLRKIKQHLGITDEET
jgi:UDP-3-O-[3-hydroxymyristoyl] glucosamine N-acyltransferase